MKKHIHSLIIILFFGFTSQAQIVLDSTTVSIDVVAENLDTPWEILWGPDDKIWFTERGGKISRLDPVTESIEVLTQIPDVFEVSESGLLGMALHPNFMHPDSQFVYVVYTYFDGAELVEKVERFTFDTDTLTNPVTLFDDIPANNNHSGSRILITDDRKILVTTGDAEDTSLSQNLGSLAGKILRLNLDGSIPADNPIPGNAAWTFGHRNAQGLVFGPTGILYSSEHGPNNDDEINIITENSNYGWPDVHGFCDPGPEQVFCTDNNVVEPITAWTPTLAVAGLDFYNHDAIPEWKNALLLVNLKERDMRVIRLNPSGDAVVDESTYLNDQYGRLRDLCVAPNGDIYVSTSNHDGRGSPIATDDRIIKLSNEQLPIDCNNEAGGTAYLDSCGICVGGSTGLAACEQDCNSEWGGSATLDSCSICVEGNTGLVACMQDCNNEWGGTAFLDSCNMCAGGSTGVSPIVDSAMCVTTGVDAIQNSLHIYPSPVSDVLHINVTGGKIINIYNIASQKILSVDYQNRVDVSGLLSGVYYVEVITTSGRLVERVLKE